MTNPLLTLIEQADKEFWSMCDEVFIGHTSDLHINKHPKRIYDLFHSTLLSIAKGECERLEGMKIDVRNRHYKTYRFPHEDPSKATDYGHNSAIFDSLEHWKEIIKFLEKSK